VPQLIRAQIIGRIRTVTVPLKEIGQQATGVTASG